MIGFRDKSSLNTVHRQAHTPPDGLSLSTANGQHFNALHLVQCLLKISN
jgi:hypothetical protein